MKAHRMSLRKQAAQYQALHQRRLISAARHLAWDVLSERWEKWQKYGIKDSDIIYTLESLINENERREWPYYAPLSWEQHQQIAEEALHKWRLAL
jgi:hypothetical protein